MANGEDFLCGVVEGFYSRPWSVDQRLDLYEKMENYSQHCDDLDSIFVAGDFNDNMLLEEEDACAVYANYRQVRQYLHKKALGRGWQKPKSPGKTIKKTNQQFQNRRFHKDI